ncbi:MAG: hypothetical protein AB1925_04740 [Actinomycetota bacterium]
MGRYRTIRLPREPTMTRRSLARVVALPAIFIAVLALVLTSCPANRDGMPGQLSSAKDETQSATRSAVMALDLWQRDRSTRQLVGVQLADARDEVTKAYEGITVLKAEDPNDLARQELLTQSMTDIIATLNQANAAVRALSRSRDPAELRSILIEADKALERDYR